MNSDNILNLEFTPLSFIYNIIYKDEYNNVEEIQITLMLCI